MSPFDFKNKCYSFLRDVYGKSNYDCSFSYEVTDRGVVKKCSIFSTSNFKGVQIIGIDNFTLINGYGDEGKKIMSSYILEDIFKELCNNRII